MPPRPRHSPRSSSRSPVPPAGNQPPTEEEYPDVEVSGTEAPDVVEPAPMEDSEPSESGSSSSGRQGTRRASRRESATSGRTSRSSVRTSASGRRRKRAGPIKKFFTLLFAIIVLGGAAFGTWYQFLRTRPEVAKAKAALAIARLDKEQILKLIQPPGRDVKTAETTYDAALKVLDIQELGFAKKDVSPDQIHLASPALAADAYSVAEDLRTSVKPRITQAERDVMVEVNLANLTARHDNLSKLDDGALAQLESDCTKFMDNPVTPETGRNEAYVKEYDLAITQVKIGMASIADEKARRLRAITSEPVRKAHLEADVLVQQERFQDALAKIDQDQRTYKDADFSKVREFVISAAKNAWETASAYAENNYQLFTSPGSSTAVRAQALKNARNRMQDVIDHFGMDEYIQKAKDALQKYQPKG